MTRTITSDDVRCPKCYSGEYRLEAGFVVNCDYTGYHDSGAICECRCGTKFQSRRVVSYESTEAPND